MASSIGVYIDYIDLQPAGSQHEIHDARIAEVSSSDNGKVLGVTSGSVGWVDPSIEAMTNTEIDTAVNTAWV